MGVICNFPRLNLNLVLKTLLTDVGSPLYNICRCIERVSRANMHGKCDYIQSVNCSTPFLAVLWHSWSDVSVFFFSFALLLQCNVFASAMTYSICLPHIHHLRQLRKGISRSTSAVPLHLLIYHKSCLDGLLQA